MVDLNNLRQKMLENPLRLYNLEYGEGATIVWYDKGNDVWCAANGDVVDSYTSFDELTRAELD